MGLTHRIAHLVMLLLVVIYVPFWLGVVGLLGYGGYQFSVFAYQRAIAPNLPGAALLIFAASLDLAVVGTSLLILLGLVPIVFRDVNEPVSGVRLEKGDHKTLFALLERYCKRLGTRMPDEAILTPFGETRIREVAVGDEKGTVRRNVRTLVIGAAHVVHLRVDEFGTILCHELAHAATGDTRFFRRIERFFNSMAAALYLTSDEDLEGEESGLLQKLTYWGLLAYYYAFAVVYFADSRRREYRADRISAEVCGPQNVRNMLIKIHLPEYLPELSIEKVFIDFAESDRKIKTNLYDEHRKRWSAMAQPNRTTAENQMFLERHGLWSSHPSLTCRMRNLANVEADEWALDKPAARLFAKWSKLEEKMSDELVAWGRREFAEHIDSLDRELRHSI